MCVAILAILGCTGDWHIIRFSPSLENVRFVHKFYADGDRGQCSGAFTGTEVVKFGQWTSAVRIDTDNRSGGCYQQFGIIDPDNALADLQISVDFRPNGQGQCDFPGRRSIPIVRGTSATLSERYRIDTDDRPGGCAQKFLVSGRSDIGLEIQFVADGDPGQCGNTGTFTATIWAPVEFRLDTDGRGGGCRQKFRLIELKTNR